MSVSLEFARANRLSELETLARKCREEKFAEVSMLTASKTQRRSPTIKAYLERIQRGDKQRRKIALIATVKPP